MLNNSESPTGGVNPNSTRPTEGGDNQRFTVSREVWEKHANVVFPTYERYREWATLVNSFIDEVDSAESTGDVERIRSATRLLSAEFTRISRDRAAREYLEGMK